MFTLLSFSIYVLISQSILSFSFDFKDTSNTETEAKVKVDPLVVLI